MQAAGHRLRSAAESLEKSLRPRFSAIRPIERAALSLRCRHRSGTGPSCPSTTSPRPFSDSARIWETGGRSVRIDVVSTGGAGDARTGSTQRGDTQDRDLSHRPGYADRRRCRVKSSGRARAAAAARSPVRFSVAAAARPSRASLLGTPTILERDRSAISASTISVAIVRRAAAVTPSTDFDNSYLEKGVYHVRVSSSITRGHRTWQAGEVFTVARRHRALRGGPLGQGLFLDLTRRPRAGPSDEGSARARST